MIDRLSTGTVGAISECLVAADLLRLGYDVFRAMSPSCSCDLIALKNGQLFRFEVRTGYVGTDGTVNFAAMPKDLGKSEHYGVATGNEVHYFPPLPEDEFPACGLNAPISRQTPKRLTRTKLRHLPVPSLTAMASNLTVETLLELT